VFLKLFLKLTPTYIRKPQYQLEFSSPDNFQITLNHVIISETEEESKKPGGS